MNILAELKEKRRLLEKEHKKNNPSKKRLERYLKAIEDGKTKEFWESQNSYKRRRKKQEKRKI